MLFKFNNDKKLESVTLESNIDKIYASYQKKYNLPNLKIKNLLYESYTENNPKYNPRLTYKVKNQTLLLPNSLIDNQSQISEVRKQLDYSNNPKNYFAEALVFSKEELIIENKQNMLIFGQKFLKNDYPYIVYSLEESKNAKKAKIVAESDCEPYYLINHPDEGITIDYFQNNSKIRTVYKMYELKQTITYISKENFIKYNNEKNKQIEFELDKKNQRAKRGEKILDEI
jgi:hypothetical protein